MGWGRKLSRWLSHYDWAAIIGSVLVLVFCLGLISGPRGNGYKGDNAAKPQHQKEHSNVVAAESSDEKLATYTLWLTCFTALLVVVSGWQGYLILRAEKLTRQSLRISQRQGAKQARDTAQSLAVAQQQAHAALEQARAASEANSITRVEFVSTHRPKIVLRGAMVASLIKGETIAVYFILANIGESIGKIVNSVVDIEMVFTAQQGRLGLTSLETLNEIGPLELAPGQAHMMAFTDLHKRAKATELPVWNPDLYGVKLKVYPNAYGQMTSGEVYDTYIDLVGQFLYEDRQGLRRRTAFRRRLIPQKQRFYKIEGEPDLDYAD